jgi:hypothetical protein
MGRANGCHYCPRWVTGVWLTVGILVLLLTGACRRGAPLSEAPAKPADAQTIEKGGFTVPPPVRVVRPRGPAYRLDNGLGSPIT